MISFKKAICITAAIAMILPTIVLGQGSISGFGPVIPASSFPSGEPGPAIIDNDSLTKYLNFGKDNSGFILTPPAASTAQAFKILAANDAPERDPGSWELYGLNGAVTETSNGQGLADAWVSIASGADAGFSTDPGRGQFGTLQSFTNASAYDSYKMIFPSVINSAGANSMQMAELQLFSDTGGFLQIGTTGGTVIEIDADAPAPGSNYPGGESPRNAIDGDLNSKYLNFAGGGTGIIFSSGSSEVAATLELITASSPGQGEQDRNPLDFNVYGTNDALTSADNSLGADENWTLILAGSSNLDATSAPNTSSGLINLNNTTAYTGFKVEFPTIANSGIMQIGEISLVNANGLRIVPEPSSIALLGVAFVGLLGMSRRRRRN